MQFLRNHRVVIAYVILTVGVVAALVRAQQANDKTAHEARTSAVEQCEGRSADRHNVIVFVTAIEANTRRSAEATASSPTATPEQKAAAERNLVAFKAADKLLTENFGPLDCSYPPPAGTTTTTVRS